MGKMLEVGTPVKVYIVRKKVFEGNVTENTAAGIAVQSAEGEIGTFRVEEVKYISPPQGVTGWRKIQLTKDATQKPVVEEAAVPISETTHACQCELTQTANRVLDSIVSYVRAHHCSPRTPDAITGEADRHGAICYMEQHNNYLSQTIDTGSRYGRVFHNAVNEQLCKPVQRMRDFMQSAELPIAIDDIAGAGGR